MPSVFDGNFKNSNRTRTRWFLELQFGCPSTRFIKISFYRQRCGCLDWPFGQFWLRMYIGIDFVYRKLWSICFLEHFMFATCVILLLALSGLNLASLKFVFSLLFSDISRLSRSPSPLQSNGKCIFLFYPFSTF